MQLGLIATCFDKVDYNRVRLLLLLLLLTARLILCGCGRCDQASELFLARWMTSLSNVNARVVQCCTPSLQST